MSRAEEIMGKLKNAMGEVDKALGPVESNVRPFVPMTHEAPPMAEENETKPASDLAPATLVEWMKLLHSQHAHSTAKMDVLEARFANEREHLLTQIGEQQNAIMERLEQIARFLGL